MLERIYNKSLKESKIIYLKTGEQVSYLCIEEHLERVHDLIGNLAQALTEYEIDSL